MSARTKKWSKKKKIIVGVIVFFILVSLITPSKKKDTTADNANATKTEETKKPEKKKKDKNLSKEEAIEAIAEAESPQEKFDIAGKFAFGKNYTSTEFFGEGGIDRVNVEFKLAPNLTTNLAKEGFLIDCGEFIELTKDIQYNQLFMGAKATFTDQYGNESENYAMKLLIPKSEIDKINFENFNSQNLANIGEVWEHPAMLK
ncbi:hypothetical protein [Peptoniphilus sp. EMRHCC_23]|uniref:hypothetical protein n=1 Tax=Peptoniphilus rachelemmaiella TaxID=2811779 RepID=UPI001C007BD7|nr:hypothetical protein [Peptoniphilus rachelemmaiella]